MIGKTVSHYKIISKLGEGGMGVVYKAEDTKLKRKVALKFLSSQSLGTPEEETRFVREAQAAASLDHPNICTVYEIEESDGHAFIAMAFVEGESLREKIDSGPLKLEEALNVGIGIARGLQEAHEKNIVHRDIKSANIMVTKTGQAKITDFGLAKLAGATKVTKTGTTVGTVAYMSPEQALGEGVDHRSDIWSLGVVLYEIITGQLPFRGEHAQAVTYQIVHENLESITALRTGLPLELDRIVNKCLEKKASDRYQHVDEVLVDLRKVTKASTPKPQKSLIKYLLPASMVFLVAVLFVIFNPFQSRITPDQGTGPVKLAVLPFENLGAPEDEYFADGITDEITSKVAVIHGLRVISRTSAKMYKGTDKGLREIGEELGVDYILEGTIRWDKQGERGRVRITPQLINVSEDFHLWAENYEREIEAIFEVQAEIASQIAKALNIALLETERQVVDERPTENLEAYQAYLRGLEYRWGPDVSREKNELAIQMFERASELDPEFALSYAALSEAHSSMYHFNHDRTQERLRQARAAVDRALELQPTLPDAHLAMAFYHYWGYRDYERALEAAATAERALPNDVRILLLTAGVWKRQGRVQAGLDRFKAAFELSPNDARVAFNIGIIYRALRQYAEADRYYDLSISLAPDQQYAYVEKTYNYISWMGDTKTARQVLERMPGGRREVQESSLVLWRLERDYAAILDFVSSEAQYIWGRADATPLMLEANTRRLMGEQELAHASYDSARVILEKELDRQPNDPYTRSTLGVAYAGLGRKESAVREGKRAVELNPVSKDAFNGPDTVLDLAVIYTMVEEYDAALDEIEFLLSIPGWISYQDLRLDPRWDPLRDHARFQGLMEKYKVD